MKLIELFKLNFKLSQLILIVQQEATMEPAELAIDQEVWITFLDCCKLAVAYRIFIYCISINGPANSEMPMYVRERINWLTS